MEIHHIKQWILHPSAYLFIYSLLCLVQPSPSIAQYQVTLEGQTYRLVLARNLIEEIHQADANTTQQYKRLVVQGPMVLNTDTLRTALAFEDVHFTAEATFENAVFLHPIHFVRTHFKKGISLFGTHFQGEFSCLECTIVDNANFKRVTFADKVNFSASHFESPAFFSQTSFMGESSFERTMFNDAAYFDKTTFSQLSHFQDATFAYIASFKMAVWQSTASFAGVRFKEGAGFEQTRFAGAATFDASYFRREANFKQADFSSMVSFRRSVFNRPAHFVKAHFRASTHFIDSRFKKGASFAGATFVMPFRPHADFGDSLNVKDISAPLIDLESETKARSITLQNISASASGCTPETTATPIQFVDITQAAGINFEHYNGFSNEYYYVETFGAGAAFLDFDGDGWLDLYLVNGASLSGSRPRPVPTNHIYHSTGAGDFTDVTATAGDAGHSGYGMGCAAADYDADGDTDLYVTNFGPNLFLRNEGGGRFTDATLTMGGDDARWGTSCGFLDYDQDGDLDLYITNYVDFDLEKNVVCAERGIRSYCEPKYYEPVGDVLYRNDGDKFVDITSDVGITLEGRGLGVAFSDYDLDGDTDIYVANDGTMHFLYQNQGNHFAEVGLFSGARYNEDGLAEAGMGVDFGDWDKDGFQDVFVTNFAHQTNTLYGNDGQGQFYDTTKYAGLAEPSYKPLGFGTNFLDYDNDTDLDLFVANGHVMDKITQVHSDHSYPQPNQMFCNQQGTRFVEVSTRLGSALLEAAVSRGSAVADYDNDGDLDLLVTNIAASPNLLRNDGGNSQHWLTIQLVGNSQREALGTRVIVTADGQSQIKERQSGGSYLSGSDPRLHFGLGQATQADIEIRWPDDSVQHIKDVKVDQILHIVQGA